MACLALAAGMWFGMASTSIAQQGQIDMQRARELFQRSQRGEKLSPEDQAYLDRAKQLRQQQGGKAPGKGQPGRGKQAGNVPSATTSTGLVPLTELGTEKYKGEDGGLYGGGSNEPPSDFRAEVEKQIAKIRPLDASGKPSSDGKIVLLSIGMSNTTMEFSAFMKKTEADSKKSPSVVVVDGAQGGKVASQWARGPGDSTPGSPWPVLNARIKAAGITDQQVQAVWMKQAEASPGQRGAFPKHAQELADNITKTLQELHTKFPNLRVVYLSNRIYAGYATTPLNPEPYSYESSFANRWVIQNQMKGDPKLAFDPDKGTVMAPAVVWGPYLWADGVKPRKGDGLVWNREDLRDNDGTHPSDSGREKVANLLLDFFQNNPLASSWYLAKGNLHAGR
jgi:hypothetical protein